MKARFYALSNELRPGTDPREIRMPLGTYPYGMADVDAGGGRTERREVVQKLDEAGARRIAEAINGRRDGPGVPVYWGHPDCPEVAKNYPDKRAKGWVTHARLEPGTPGALVLVLGAWNESPQGGFGWFSPYWTGELELQGGGTAVLHVSELVSVGLTNTPNIREFRLANEESLNNKTRTKEQIMELQKLIELLGLPPDATEEAVAAAIAKGKAALDAAAGAESAASEAETAAADAKTRAEAAEAEAAEARKKQEEAETALANERKARIALVLDAAIADGHIAPAARTAWEKRLGEDFEAGQLALANERAVKTRAATAGLNPRDDADNAAKLLELANERRTKTGCPFDEAWEYAKRCRAAQ